MLRSLFDSLKCSFIDPPTGDGISHDVTNDFLVPGCICALAANENSTDTVWFVKILERCEVDQPYTDDYGLRVAKEQEFFSEKYLEWVGKTRHKTSFQEMRKTMFLYKTGFVYPFLTLKKSKSLYSISEIDYCDITSYLEHFDMMPP